MLFIMRVLVPDNETVKVFMNCIQTLQMLYVLWKGVCPADQMGTRHFRARRVRVEALNNQEAGQR